jgi:hypothetical protein
MLDAPELVAEVGTIRRPIGRLEWAMMIVWPVIFFGTIWFAWSTFNDQICQSTFDQLDAMHELNNADPQYNIDNAMQTRMKKMDDFRCDIQEGKYHEHVQD